MKFLLVAINAKYIHSNPAVYSLRAMCPPDLADMVEIAEYTINQQEEDILGDIYERGPQAIGFSCYIWNWSMVKRLLGHLGKILPGVPLWLGGPEASQRAQELLREFPQVTGVMVGEGEATFGELMARYAGADTEEVGAEDLIMGLVIRRGEDIIHTGERPATDMSCLPFLYEHPEAFANKILYYESSRGCPYRCSYCLSSLEKGVRLRSLDLVKRELKVLLEHRVRQVKFIDRTFNARGDHALEIWRFIHEKDNGVTNFHFEIGADTLTEDQLQVLGAMRPGQVQLEIGVQSANARTLRAVHRNPDLSLLEANVGRIRGFHNIHQHLDLIAGLPYEDYESFRQSFHRVYGMGPHQLQLGFLKVLAGSEMERRAKEWGICYREEPPYEVLYTRWLSYQELRRLKGVEAMVEAYYNSGQFARTLACLEGAFPSAFDMYDELSQYYKEKGYDLASPARVHRYRILLDFATRKDEGRGELYRQSLVFDLYSRENVKSRPAFAGEWGVDKAWMREFFSREAAERKFLPHYRDYDARQLARMTHVEEFTYPVWEQDWEKDWEQGKERCRQQGSWYVLFDYKQMDPIRESAAILVWRKEGTCINPISASMWKPRD